MMNVKQVAMVVLGVLVLGLMLAPRAEAARIHAGDVVVRDGTGNGPVIFEIRDDRAYLGNAATAEVAFSMRGTSIYAGAQASGEVIFTDKGCLRLARKGNCVLELDGDRVLKFRTGEVIYEFHEDRVYAGRQNAILTTDLELRNVAKGGDDLEDLAEIAQDPAADAADKAAARMTLWMVIALLETQAQ